MSASLVALEPAARSGPPSFTQASDGAGGPSGTRAVPAEAGGRPGQPRQDPRPPSQEDVERVVAEANRLLEWRGVERRYTVVEGTGQVVVTLLDSQTKEVVAEIPPRRLVEALAGILKGAGVLLDEKG